MKRIFCLLGLALGISLSAAPFTFNKGDRISIIGNTLADRMQHSGWLETFIHARYPKHELVFRNLAFPGDTITTRPRSANFGSPDQWLTKLKTDVVFMFFGYNESFAGEAGLAKFKTDLANLLKHTKQQKYNGKFAPRIVLFTPIAHEDLKKEFLPDGKVNNVRLKLYAKAMLDVADSEGVRCVDLFQLTQQGPPLPASNKPITMNGVHLNATGQQLVAQAISGQLLGGKAAGPLANIRQAVLDKNHHWWSRYRTVDGYNVYGGRSRLAWNGQSNADVMQREMEIFDVMTANRDKAIWAAAQGKLNYKVDDSNTPEPLKVKTNRRGPNQDGSFPYLGAKEAIGKMKIHEGMKVNVFASEEMFPELINPVQMAVDTDSRLWVATWPSYPHWHPKKPMGDKLVILPDEDGDGVADKMITFADNLNSITGFEFWGGGVLVAAAPELLFLKDTDGDDKADVRIRLAQGVSSADTHHTANALTIGPGGWLYWSRGVFHVTNMETPTKTFRSTRSGVYRFNPRTFEIEFHFPIGPNPHGNAFDRWGFQFATDGTSGTGSYVNIGRGMGAPKQFYQKRVRPVPASGILSSTHFGPKHEGNFLICNAIGFLGVLSHKFEYNGADITAREVEPIVVSSDPNFRPSDIEVGGDGALYVADWHNALIGHMQHNMRDPNRDDTHGRVYRVTVDGRPLAKPAKMRGKPIATVLEHLKAPDNGTRYRARLELSGRKTPEVIAAIDAFTAKLDPKKMADTQPLLESLWVCAEHQHVHAPLLRRALQSAHPRARAAAVRTLGTWGPKVKGGIALLQTAAADAEPVVRAEAVKAAVSFEGLPAAEVVVAAATKKTDVQLDHVLNYARNTLKVDAVLNEAVTNGAKLSAATQAYLLRNASNAALLKMDKTEAVHRAILTRAGIGAPDKLAAATALAKSGNSTPLRVTLATVKALDAEDDTAAITSTSPVVAALLAESAENVTGELEALAFRAKHDATREVGLIGLLTRNPDSKPLWEHAMKSTENLNALLAAVPKLQSKNGAAQLAARIRPLMFELPEALRRTQTNQVGHAHHHATAGKGGPVKVEVYRPNFGANIKNYQNRKPVTTKHAKDFALGKLGESIEKVSLRFTTTLNITRPGTYTFFTNSDDGSRLYINDKLVVNNDGNHGMVERSGQVRLSGGGHKLVVTYFDSGGGDGLIVSWQGPGIPKQPIPAKALGEAGPNYATQTAAVRAIHSLPGDGATKFADFAKVIASGKGRRTAIPAALAIPEKDWPDAAVKSLGAEYASVAAETPFAQRDGAAFKQVLALGEKLAARLPAAEAKALRDSLGNLDLQVVRIGTIFEKMKYNKASFSIVSGKPTKIVFVNDDKMPHNLLIAAPGALADLGAAADKMAADPQGFAKHFVPDDKRVLWSTKLLQPGQTAELSFIAPKPGAYPFVCTFPLHWKLMNGTMQVMPDDSEKK